MKESIKSFQSDFGKLIIKMWTWIVCMSVCATWLLHSKHSFTKCIYNVVSETSDFILFLLQFFVPFFSFFTQISFKYHQKKDTYTHTSTETKFILKMQKKKKTREQRRRQRWKKLYVFSLFINLCGDILIFMILHYVLEHTIFGDVDR